jgi:hypothetical protein
VGCITQSPFRVFRVDVATGRREPWLDTPGWPWRGSLREVAVGISAPTRAAAPGVQSAKGEGTCAASRSARSMECPSCFTPRASASSSTATSGRSRLTCTSRRGTEKPSYGCSPCIAYSHRMTPAELRRVRELVFEHQAVFLEWWHEHFRG